MILSDARNEYGCQSLYDDVNVDLIEFMRNTNYDFYFTNFH